MDGITGASPSNHGSRHKDRSNEDTNKGCCNGLERSTRNLKKSSVSFQAVIDAVDGQGRFQKRLLYLTLTPLLLVVPVAWVNEIFLVHVPNHSCSHPSLDLRNSTQIALFQQCFVPKINVDEFDPCHVLVPSDLEEDAFWRLRDLEGICQSYNISDPAKNNDNDNKMLKCEQGYVFDKTNFRRTIVTENAWVCDKHLRVPTLLTWAAVGVAFGTGLFSYTSDTYGRRFTLFLALIVAVITSLLKTFFSHFYVLYVVLKTIAAAVLTALYYVPFSLITEMVDNDFRSWAVGYTCLTWAGGLCILPILAYLTADWRLLSFVTVAAIALLLVLSIGAVPESPRFLLGQGKVEEAAKIVQRMARVNKRDVPKELEQTLQSISDDMRNEHNLGFVSLFSRGMALRTTLLTLGLVHSMFLYNQLTLNVEHMPGNLFINFFLLAIVEPPATYAAYYMADHMGRRWSHTLLIAVDLIALCINASIAHRKELEIWVSILCFIGKINSSATFAIIFIQIVEFYPTKVRNMGMGVTYLISQLICLSGPHVIHLNVLDKRLPYAVMAVFCLMSALAVAFLPETMGIDLPDTMHEAADIGRHHKFFSYMPNNRDEQNKSSDSPSRQIESTII